MAAAPATPDDGLAWHLLETIGGAIFGAVVAMVAFRTRLSKMDGRMNNQDGRMSLIETSIQEHAEDTTARWRASERRQLFMLEVLSDIANKVGANERMSDLTIRLLSQENQQPEERR